MGCWPRSSLKQYLLRLWLRLYHTQSHYLRVYLLACMPTSSCFTVTADGFEIAAGATPVAELQADTKLKLVATATAGSTVVGKVIGVTKLEGVEAYSIGKAGS